MNFSGILHNRWFLYGAGGLLVIILVMRLVGSSSAGTVTTVSAGPTADQLNAQTQLALAQIGAAQATTQTNAQLAAQQAGYQEDLAKTGIEADLSRYSIDAQTTLTKLQIAAQSASDERQADLSATVAKWTLDQASEMQANNNAFQLAYANNANQTAIAQAQTIAAVSMADIQAQRDVSVAAMSSAAAQAASYAGAQVAINDSNNAKDIGVANINAGVEKHKSDNGLFGSIIGGIAGIFSDRRLKRDLVFIGTDADGINRYAYRYVGERSFQVGVMADEVPARALGPRVNGFATVNYRQLKAA